jgi:hypothetical protein
MIVGCPSSQLDQQNIGDASDALAKQQDTGQRNQGFEQEYAGYAADLTGAFKNLPTVTYVG